MARGPLAKVTWMGDDDGPPLDTQAESLAHKFEKEGLDTRFLEEPFLEASELGDPASLRSRLGALEPDERRRLVKAVDQQGRTGLLLAARRGDTELAQVLLDFGANPNEADNGGATALHHAASFGSSGLVELLLHCRADVEKKDDDGEPSLLWASNGRVADLLLEAGADGQATNSAGRSALMLASRRGRADLVRSLAKLPGVDLDAKDGQGCSAHAAALAEGHTDVGDLLVELGATASAPRGGGGRAAPAGEALLEAARRGDAAACEAALRGAVDVNAEIGGETPLLLAAGLGAGRAVEVLLQARADPNKVDPYLSESPLLRAVHSHASNELLWMLLEARADPALGDLTGRTPEAIASSWGNDGASEILRAAASGQLAFGTMD